jgi:hypothetical protein
MFAVAALAACLSGCGKKEEAAPKPAPAPKQPAEPEPKKDVAPPPVEPAKDAPPPAPAPDALIDYDLSGQGGKWTGWTVKSPPDGKLEANDHAGAFPGGVAIRWGNGAGAMGFAQGKLDFKSVKKDFKVSGDTVVTAETPDQLDATMTMMGTELKCLYMNRKAGDVTVGCWTVSCVMTDDELARAHAICDSLAKK